MNSRIALRIGVAAVLGVSVIFPASVAVQAATTTQDSATVPMATASPSPSLARPVAPIATVSPSPSPSAVPPTLRPVPTSGPTTGPTTKPTIRPTSPGIARPLPATLPPDYLSASTTYRVTFAARWCPEYTDVRANKARNNIMESLQNLGPDTNYSGSEAVNPGKEDAPPQSACTPFTGWNFQLGNGINGVTPGTNLSRVANPGTVVTTASSVPELDASGAPTGRSIAGAVTLTLTSQQVQDAANRKLWIQGGTAGDPLGQAQFPGEFGFAALRCANDNVNGDNVEYVNFTSSQRHVFCYYYAVKPPPEAGIIVIKKALAGVASSDLTFNFGGNTSYNPGGAFSLKGGQSIEFVRGDSKTTGFEWRVSETIPPDWRLAITCDSPGDSITRLVGNNEVSISLAAGDRVTCTFTNSPNPPPNTLELGKFADGADGAFGMKLTAPSGRVVAQGTVNALDSILKRIGSYDITETGAYRLVETMPVTTAGTWELTEVRCSGATGRVVNSTTAEITVAALNARSGSYCVLVNTFTPNAGSLLIRSVTVGGAGGESSYVVAESSPAAGTTSQTRNHVADNTAADVLVDARPVDPAVDSTNRLDPGSYTVQGFGPAASATEEWRLTSIACSGGAASGQSLSSGTITVALPARGSVVCDFTWAKSAASTLQVTKQAVLAGGSRTSDVVISTTCLDGSVARLQVAPTTPLPASMPAPLYFQQDTTCTVTETGRGGNPAETTWTAVTPYGTTTGTGTSVAVGIRHATFAGSYEVTFTNTYSAGSPTPTPPPTATPTPSVVPSPTDPGDPDERLPQEPVKPLPLPETIDPDGPTVIIPEEIPTNAGQPVRVILYCEVLPRTRSASALVPRGDVRTCVVQKTRSGRITLIVNYPGPIRVWAVTAAPGTPEYKPYVAVKNWVIGR